ncbi:hypothetical protein [Salinactinospora qingdaonensis]|uniref:Amidase n=1 Tax=Salinactinospora qingdaonensis TaxID=702744 RepID=A0ABP7FTW4_9ACTN
MRTEEYPLLSARRIAAGDLAAREVTATALECIAHPAVSIPAGRTPAGGPVGLHLVAPPGREADLLAVVSAAEAHG